MSREKTKVPSRGASSSKTGMTDALAGWWKHHQTSAGDSLRRLLATPMQTLMTAMVVAIAMALPATLLTFLDNVQRLGDSWDSNPKLSAFIHVRAQPKAIELLQKKLNDDKDIQNVLYISPDQALAEFQSNSGFSEVLSVLDENPLPPTLIITPTAEASNPEAIGRLRDRIVQESIVGEVDMDMDWVRRLKAIMALGEQIVLGLAALLCLGVLLAIGNTIRLAIENRREEIVVVKLVGGTDGFVRRPFLYTGAWYGAIGGLLACTLVSLGFAIMSGAVENLSATYQSDFELAGLGFEGGCSLMLISTSLGLFGAWVAVGRHLSDIEPK